MAAWCYAVRKMNGWMQDLVQEVRETTRLARRATELGRDDTVALCWGGYALAYVAGDVDSQRGLA
jgi:adenylate cyclase